MPHPVLFLFLLMGISLNVAAEVENPGKGSAPEVTIQLFDDGSLQAIEQKYAGQNFILVLWSLECFSCYSELKLLKEWQQRYPQIRQVLVNVDGPGYLEETSELLGRLKLSGSDNWLFGKKPATSLRYQIDPKWYGELPRNYFYAANRPREGVSGLPDESMMRQWAALNEEDAP